MAKELVNLSNKLDNMQDRLKEYPELQDKFNVKLFKNIFYRKIDFGTLLNGFSSIVKC
jgi:hypothetical protein